MSQELHDGNDDGVSIGAAATAKVGFYGATPVVQPATIADATSGDAHTQLNDLLAKLETLGILASS